MPVKQNAGLTDLQKEVLETWQAYLATGLHATTEEVDAWLAKLEAGELADPPSPHS